MKDTILRDAENGDPYACLGVAYYYQTGKGFDQDYETAIEWYERAAVGGCPRAHWELARIYRDGIMAPSNISHYLRHLTAAADLGNAMAQMTLANEYWTGKNLDQSDMMAFNWFRRAAENGEARAKFMVGYFYSKGIGVEMSQADAELWYSATGFLGDADMFMNIGLSFEYGTEGLERDEIEAARWYKFGVDMGHEKCMICWRSLSETLQGNGRDTYEVRMHKLNNSATDKEINIRNSALYIADECFEMGDTEKAFAAYEQAAGLGSPTAMFTIAMFYHNGICVKRNDKKALELLVRAASAGSDDAQFYLGRMYDTGRIPKDENEAIKYYAKAAGNGFLPALYYLGQYIDHPEVYVRRTKSR